MNFARKQFLPRGIRNNNPGNIRRNDIEWQGMQAIQNDDDFVQFNSPEYGFRAMTRILRRYNERGLNTVRSIISTYAPHIENDTDAYINFVSGRLGVDANTVLDIESVMLDLVTAITIFENGQRYADFYDSDIIQSGIALA